MMLKSYCLLLLVFWALLLSCLPGFWFFMVPPLPRACPRLDSAELSPFILPLLIVFSRESRTCWSSTAGLQSGSARSGFPAAPTPATIAEPTKEDAMMDRSQVETLLTNAYAARRRGDVDAICSYFVDNPSFVMAGARDASPLAVQCTDGATFRTIMSGLIATFEWLDHEILATIIDGRKAA